MGKPYTHIVALLLLAVFALLAITSIWPDKKSPTCDELAHHIPVGYVLLNKWDFKMDPSHPPLSRYIVALPLHLFMRPSIPYDKTKWRRPDRADFGRDFFYKYNNQPHWMIFLSRLAVVVAGVFCGIILFMWVRVLYGKRVALFCLFLYCFSPNILAHARLATTDMVATAFILLSICTFWFFTKDPTLENVIFAGICLGLAQLTKYTSLLLYPMFLILAGFEHKRNMMPKLILIFLVSIIVLWAGYGFDSKPILEDAMRVGEKIEIARSIAEKAIPFWNKQLSRSLGNFLINTPFLLGTHVLGILGVIRHAYEGHGIFLLGKWSSHGNPLYFIVAFLIKTPIPTIIFLVLGLIIVLKERIGRNERFILATIALFFITASLSRLQLGLRHILPIYPFFFILAARSVWAGKSLKFLNNKVYKKIGILLMAWYVFSSLWIHPHYLSYFNELIGGPRNGYKYLRDSNIDWGQDLPALAKYMKKNNIEKIKLFYFGTAKPESYGINWEPITEQELERPGADVYAVSVHDPSIRWTGRYKPTDRAGYSILIYDFRNKKWS